MMPNLSLSISINLSVHQPQIAPHRCYRYHCRSRWRRRSPSPPSATAAINQVCIVALPALGTSQFQHRALYYAQTIAYHIPRTKGGLSTAGEHLGQVRTYPGTEREPWWRRYNYPDSPAAPPPPLPSAPPWRRPSPPVPILPITSTAREISDVAESNWMVVQSGSLAK
jgi:hypothetical protein